MAGTITAYETAHGTRYHVRYRKADRTHTDKRGFKTKRDAALFLSSVTVTKVTGETSIRSWHESPSGISRRSGSRPRR